MRLVPGIFFALASAALFGASTPLAKLLLGSVNFWMLAGLLYLGCGLGLGLFHLCGPSLGAQRTRLRSAPRICSGSPASCSPVE